MSNPIVHFEISGADPGKLRGYYTTLFGWTFDTDSPVAPSISEAGSYGFTTIDDSIPGGVGGGQGFPSHALFYVGVEDVAAALAEAVALGGTTVLGPEANPNGQLVVAHFTDPRATSSDSPAPNNRDRETSPRVLNRCRSTHSALQSVLALLPL